VCAVLALKVITAKLKWTSVHLTPAYTEAAVIVLVVTFVTVVRAGREPTVTSASMSVILVLVYMENVWTKRQATNVTVIKDGQE